MSFQNDDAPLLSSSEQKDEGAQKKRKIIAISVLSVVVIVTIISAVMNFGDDYVSSTQQQLKAYLVDAEGIYCNDGTQPGFYFSASVNDASSGDWVVLLPGGHFCWDNDSCESRALTENKYWTGPTEGDLKDGVGILSAIEDENPDLFEANHVELVYCSSDSWLGDKTYGPEDNMFTDNMYFQGGPMATAILTDLLENYGMAEANNVVLAGASAAGIAMLSRFEELKQQILDVNPAIKVTAMLDGPWYLYDRAYEGYEQNSTAECGWLYDWIDPIDYLHPGCVASETDDVACFFGNEVWPYISAEAKDDMFLAQQMFDVAHNDGEGFRELNTEAAEDITDPYPYEGAEIYAEQLAEAVNGIQLIYICVVSHCLILFLFPSLLAFHHRCNRLTQILSCICVCSVCIKL